MSQNATTKTRKHEDGTKNNQTYRFFLLRDLRAFVAFVLIFVASWPSC